MSVQSMSGFPGSRSLATGARGSAWEPTHVDLRDKTCTWLSGVLLGVLCLFAGLVLFESRLDWFMDRSGTLARTFTRNFRLTGENTVPAWFNAGLLWTCGAGLVGVGVMRLHLALGRVVPWLALGLLFFGLSADESLSWHELSAEPAKALITPRGVFGYAWVIFGIAFVAVMACLTLPWLLRLPRPTRTLMIVSAVVFVAGALGCEMLSAPLGGATKADRGLGHFLLQNLEEVLEMTGLVLFLHAITTYLFAVHRQNAASSHLRDAEHRPLPNLPSPH